MRALPASPSASCRASAAAAPPFFSLASRAEASSDSRRAFSADRPFTTSTRDSRRVSIASRASSSEASASDSGLPSPRLFVSFTSSSSASFSHAVPLHRGQSQKAPRRRIAPRVHVLAGERAQRRAKPQGQRRLHESFGHAGATIAAFRGHRHKFRGRVRAHGELERLPRGRDRMRRGEVHLASGEAGRRLDGRDGGRKQGAKQVEIEVGDDGIREIPRRGQRGLENPDPTGGLSPDLDRSGPAGGEERERGRRRGDFFESEEGTGGTQAQASHQSCCDTRPFEEIFSFFGLRPVPPPEAREQDAHSFPFYDSPVSRLLSSRNLLLVPAEARSDLEEREVLLAAARVV